MRSSGAPCGRLMPSIVARFFNHDPTCDSFKRGYSPYETFVRRRLNGYLSAEILRFAVAAFFVRAALIPSADGSAAVNRRNVVVDGASRYCCIGSDPFRPFDAESLSALRTHTTRRSDIIGNERAIERTASNVIPSPSRTSQFIPVVSSAEAASKSLCASSSTRRSSSPKSKSTGGNDPLLRMESIIAATS